MKKIDIDMLDEKEREALEGGFDREALPGRMAGVLLGAFAGLAVAVSLLVLEASPATMALAFIGYIALVTLEKASHARSQFVSRAVIRKLVRRIERLEGVKQTPDHGSPTVPSKQHSGSEAA